MDEGTPSSRELVLGWQGDFEPDLAVDAEAVPFAPALLGIAAVARQQLARRAQRQWSAVLPAVQRQLETGLLRSLADLCLRALQLEYWRFREHRVAGSPVSETTLYSEFCDQQRRQGLRPLCRRYPVLRHLLRLLSGDWVRASAELLQRFDTDAARLSREFDASCGLDALASVETALSDRHDGGRTVVSLSFDDGRCVVYKPRDVGMEHAYNQCIQWFNATRSCLALRTVEVLPCRGYGWAERVEQRACATEEEVQRYYFRAGMLVAFWALVGATDCHMSNVVACGDQPVLVDVETLFDPETLRSQRHGNTLRSLRFLPERDSGVGVSYDLTGLGGHGSQPTDRLVPVWRPPGAEPARLEYRLARLKEHQNVVRLNGIAQKPREYAGDILRGLEAMHEVLLRQRSKLLAMDGPLWGLARQPRRSIHRATRQYAALLSTSLQPECLQRATVRRRVFEIGAADITSPELRSLRRMDMPRFVTPAGSHFDTTWKSLCERFAALDAGVLQSQQRQVRLALAGDLLLDLEPPASPP